MPDIKYFSNVQSKSTGDVYVVKDEGAREQIDDIYKYNGEMGAKNLLVPKWTETHTTENGVTYTFNADGTIIMNTDASGATASTNCNLRQNTVSTNNVFPAGSYTFTGCPAGGSSTKYRTWLRAYRPNTNTALTDNLYEEGNGVSFTVSEPFSLGINATVRSGYVCNNLTWKPMLRYASDTDNTYQPYAKTNRQLTEDVSVPKYNSTGEYIYYEGGDQFTGKIDSTPTAGSTNAVSSGGTKTYVDNALSSIGAFRPCGTVTFANLPSLSSALTGDMYNISDAFTTTSDFKEGAGHSISAGANVYKTSDGMWDILAGVTVTGVKGDKEQNYRTGNINLTPANIGAIANPSTAGTNGQVLTADGSGGASWQDAQSPLVFDNVPTQGSSNPVKSGGIFSTMAVPKYDSANRREYFEGGGAFGGNIDSTPTAGSNNAVASGGVKTYVDNADAALNTAIGERVKIASVSSTVNCTTADSTAIGGHKTGGSEAKALSSFAGYPTGKTVVGWSLSACGTVANVLAVVHVAAGYAYVNAAYSGTFTVEGFVFYKD